MGSRVRMAAAWVGLAVSAAGVAAGITATYRGMRDLMVESGGVCARGGPFEVASECSDAQIVLLLGGIVGTLVFAGLHSGFSAWARGPSLGPFAIAGAGMAALGWNFLELGLDPPQGGGTDVGWLVSGVLFWLMAAGFVAPAVLRAAAWVRRGGEPEPPAFRPGLVQAVMAVPPRTATTEPEVAPVPTRLVPPRPPGGSP